jgi:deoxyribodipyrimidine photo-lyase
MPGVPNNRITVLKDVEPDLDKDYVLYWMINFKRTSYNFALERAVEIANELSKPLLIFEPLILDYPMSSVRFHKFFLEGMKDVSENIEKTNAYYYPYIEETPRASDELLAQLVEKAAAVVTDDYPTYFVPQMTAKAKGIVNTRYELVDANGLAPIRIAEKEYVRAHDFRRYLHKNLIDFLVDVPKEEPLKELKVKFDDKQVEDIENKWKKVDFKNFNQEEFLRDLNIDKTVKESQIIGGYKKAKERLDYFLQNGYLNYATLRSHPSEDASSRLSPYLHAGHISPYEIFVKVNELESWSPENINPAFVGRRQGWWGGSENLESFFDELITWRELGYHTCVTRANYDQYSSLPQWAIKTLEEHANDPREHTYTLSQLVNSETHDEIWNAAQTQLREEGIIHNYLRMLWAKKILEWVPNPQLALSYMIDLNDRFALDGRDPNSYSGVFWTLGRYDRAWGPERKIYGKIRYMTSENTAKKFKLDSYLEKYGS